MSWVKAGSVGLDLEHLPFKFTLIASDLHWNMNTWFLATWLWKFSVAVKKKLVLNLFQQVWKFLARAIFFFLVFKNILGDTILIDDLDSANNYRRAVSDFAEADVQFCFLN